MERRKMISTLIVRNYFPEYQAGEYWDQEETFNTIGELGKLQLRLDNRREMSEITIS